MFKHTESVTRCADLGGRAKFPMRALQTGEEGVSFEQQLDLRAVNS